jgi:hypothetical protein
MRQIESRLASFVQLIPHELIDLVTWGFLQLPSTIGPCSLRYVRSDDTTVRSRPQPRPGALATTRSAPRPASAIRSVGDGHLRGGGSDHTEEYPLDGRRSGVACARGKEAHRAGPSLESVLCTVRSVGTRWSGHRDYAAVRFVPHDLQNTEPMGVGRPHRGQNLPLKTPACGASAEAAAVEAGEDWAC